MCQLFTILFSLVHNEQLELTRFDCERSSGQLFTQRLVSPFYTVYTSQEALKHRCSTFDMAIQGVVTGKFVIISVMIKLKPHLLIADLGEVPHHEAAVGPTGGQHRLVLGGPSDLEHLLRMVLQHV